MNRLLIIDDDRDIARFISTVAGSIGFQTQSTDEAAAFLAQVEGWDPTVLVVDLLMPKVDGVQLLRELAKLRTSAAVVIISGMDVRTIETVRRMGNALGLNIVGVAVKPIRVEDLKSLLRTFYREAEPVTGEMLRAAIESRALYLEYQPKLHLGTMALAGAEALVRWRLPSGRMVPPDAFVTLAEREGLIDALTEHVIGTAVRQIAGWRRQGLDRTVSLAINISALNLQQRDLPERIQDLCREADVPTSALILEVTETATMKDPILTMEVLTRLRIHGFGVSLDDFGTGYSSMLQLVRLPFTEIKIDRSFVGEMDRVSDAAAVTKLTVDLGHSLGLKVTAEGVESQQACDMLRQFGCDMGQGYLFSKPVPGDELMLSTRLHSHAAPPPTSGRDLVHSAIEPDRLKAEYDLPPVIEQVFDYWNAKRSARTAPQYDEFDPVDMPQALKNLILWNVTQQDRDPEAIGFVCQTAGTEICGLAGRELRGLTVEEMHWDAPAKIRLEFMTVAKTQQVHYVEREMQWTERPYRRYRRLLMPLVGKSARVERLLGCIDFD